MLRKLPIVAVLGQGSPLSAERARLAREAGAAVARLGAHLLTGGGYGVMQATAEGFVAVDERPGFSIGVVPRDPNGALDSVNRDETGRPYPNASVEIAIFTPLPPRAADWRAAPTRNHVNVLSADVFLVLPGNAGTKNELDMAAHYRGEADRAPTERRTVLIGPVEEFTAEHRKLFVHAAGVAEAEKHLRRILAARGFGSSAGATGSRRPVAAE
jgi:predicted Rossmann-fold nucleotide-binding protein